MWMITNFEFEVRSLNFAKNIESENVVVVVQTGRPIGIEATNYDMLKDSVKVSHQLEALYFCEEELIWS